MKLSGSYSDTSISASPSEQYNTIEGQYDTWSDPLNVGLDSIKYEVLEEIR